MSTQADRHDFQVCLRLEGAFAQVFLPEGVRRSRFALRRWPLLPISGLGSPNGHHVPSARVAGLICGHDTRS